MQQSFRDVAVNLESGVEELEPVVATAILMGN